jgi:hypothetical protein
VNRGNLPMNAEKRKKGFFNKENYSWNNYQEKLNSSKIKFEMKEKIFITIVNKPF